MRIAVIDTETTGMGPGDQIVELGIVSWSLEEEYSDAWSTLVRPTCPVSLEARAVHHISDNMLSKAWTFQEILQHRGLPELGILGEGHEDDGYAAEPTVMFAHNLVFDATMIEQTMPGIKLPERRACSWRCALHKYPESPAHSNQVLRYYLELKVPEYKSLPPHRALPDALVTAEIVKEMLKTSTVDELIELTSKPVLLGTVRFGKFRGMKWSELEDGYLRWILSKDFDADARYTARHWLQHRSAQKPLLQPR